jgi:hypothetical protein
VTRQRTARILLVLGAVGTVAGANLLTVVSGVALLGAGALLADRSHP